MTDDELYGLLKPVLAAALEAGREYERLPPDQRGAAPHLDDGAARGLPPALCALARPHVRRAFETGREQERAERARWDGVAAEAIAEFGRGRA